MLAIARKFVAHVVPGVIKPLRVLWNEVIGFVFLCLAAWSIPSTYRAVRGFNGTIDDVGRIAITGLFAAMMLGFGLFSFLRARRIGRS